MKLKYTVDREDLIALARYGSGDPVNPARSRHRARIWAYAIVLGLAIVFSLVYKSPLPLLVAGAGLLVGPFLPPLFRHEHSAKAQDRAATLGNVERVLCEHELELLTAGVAMRAASGELTKSFAEIEKIDRTDTHGFIFFGAVASKPAPLPWGQRFLMCLLRPFARSKPGIVIPRSRVIEGDFDAFMDALSEKWQAAEAATGRGQSPRP